MDVASFPRFWLCLLRSGTHVPTHRHATEQSARDEAARLVRQYGGSCTVLEAVAEVTMVDVQWTELTKQEPEAPF